MHRPPAAARRDGISLAQLDRADRAGPADGRHRPGSRGLRRSRGGTFTWPHLVLRPDESWQVRLAVTGQAVPEPSGHPVAPRGPVPWSQPTITSDDVRLRDLVRQGLWDLDSLRLADPLSAAEESAEDQFIAAGCPWYLTLFGRDSIWAARMLLPLGTGIARGTLWALARRQGRVHDVFREEAPGRILHELRPATARHGHGLLLPSHYYGSVDATPLFVTLLVEAWHWGLPDAEVDALLPYAERAMAWARETSEKDEDGLLRYYPRAGGLRHQSWKDSEDAVRDAEGRHIGPPLALCEVQGYAYEAATGLALLLTTRGRAREAAHLRDWAEALRKRFAELFWIPARTGPAPRYVAIAVGQESRPVSGPASNMGQLLSTGILDEDGCRDTAAWLASPACPRGGDCAAVPRTCPASTLSAITAVRSGPTTRRSPSADCARRAITRRRWYWPRACWTRQ